MAKRRPHYDLELFKAVCGSMETVAISRGALESGIRLGFGIAEITAAVRTMHRHMFVKSMTSYNDHRSWQDVYHVPLPNGAVAM